MWEGNNNNTKKPLPVFSLQRNPADRPSPLPLPTPHVSLAHLQNWGNDLRVVGQREDGPRREGAVAKSCSRVGRRG